LLPWDQELAAAFLWTGRIFMVLALLTAGACLLFQTRRSALDR
jgi:hypothetical protein